MKAHLLYLVAGIATASATPLISRSSTTYFFTFGNSYTKSGFDITGDQPSRANPMGNPAIGSNTSSGGPNWVGYLTATYNESLVLNYDLAVGGATIDNELVNDEVKDMTHQVADFKSAYGKGPWDGDNTLFAFWIGINDIGRSYKTNNSSTLVPKLIKHYENVVDEVYATGGRKFLFLNVPATTRTPKIIGEGKTKQHAAWVSAYNDALKTMAKSFNDDHKDAKVVVYDSWSFMSKILDSPQEHGFKDSVCQDKHGVSCVWYNDYHPGKKYHQLQAKDMKQHLEAFGGW
ncbi:hypothetical protein N7492_004589 [Penicillium capsulatum]|uniref:Cellulose-binding GDSL lipase/acylhydrolase n=1 Tax=Penicillium capsulatum TaxID=69766 RepID=A0A9W9I869_9EURO|nr:hypothetical protein N7492_004589 [Penicillium capsulatum]KAJ6136294.1 hypothetical protein N7512_001454 [Penicillium capsulatum]